MSSLPPEIIQILIKGDADELRALFSFNRSHSNDEIRLKFDLWSRRMFPTAFKHEDAPFHAEWIDAYISLYRGINITSLVNCSARGLGKDVKTKLFVSFVVLNDLDHQRKFFRILTADLENAEQMCADIYNMLCSPDVKAVYGMVIPKKVDDVKKMNRIDNFDTIFGVKITADTVGVSQRGKVQDINVRPDVLIYNDFETRDTLWSATQTHKIWGRMEEARTGLEKGGASLYLCNYLSENGNVHRLISNELESRKVILQPIADDEGNPLWSYFTREDIELMRKEDDDFEGERMCRPSAAKDVFFKRDRVDAMPTVTPVDVVGGVNYFGSYLPSHRYGIGADVAGGIGLDSSTIVAVDFSTIPATVVATYASNEIDPEALGHLAHEVSRYFGGCITAIENNKFDRAIMSARQLGCNLFKRTRKAISVGVAEPTEYGWNTNASSKQTMLQDLRRAIDDGVLTVPDKNLVAELRSYTRNDTLDRDVDVRMATRHYDLLIALAIAWQMNSHSVSNFIPERLSYWNTQEREVGNIAE